VGQCEGGVVAVDYATRYPEQVKSVVISSTQCYSGIPMPEWNRKKFPKPFSEMDRGFQEKLGEWHGKERASLFFDSNSKGVTEVGPADGSSQSGSGDQAPTSPPEEPQRKRVVSYREGSG